MKEVCIGFSKPKNRIFPIYSYLIRLIEGTEYSHVYIKWTSEKHKVDIVYQASSSFVNFMGLSNFYNHNEQVCDFKLIVSDVDFDSYMKWAITNAGTGYGCIQVLGLLGVKLWKKLTGRNIKNPFHNGLKKQICVELVGHFLRDIVKIDVTEDLDCIGLKEIYSYAKQASHKELDS